MHPSGEQYEIESGGRRAVAVEVGGGLRTFDGVLLGYEVEEMAQAGRGQVLAPWPNRIAEGRYSFGGRELQLALTEPSSGSAIHGLVRWANWSCVEHQADAVTLEHVMHPQPGYPFALSLRITYRLDDRGLTVETSAENVGGKPAPFGIGHHPYFLGAPLADDLEIEIDGESFVVGDRKLDETRSGLVSPRVRVGEHVLWFEEPYRYVQLFTGDHPHVHRRGFAVEPMTCPPNAFRTGEGLLVLEPAEIFRGRWGIEVGGTLPALPS